MNSPERLRVEGRDVLHGADELALQQVEPLVGALVHRRERGERAVDHACPGPQRAVSVEKEEKPRAAPGCGSESEHSSGGGEGGERDGRYAPHTSRAWGISASLALGRRATSSELRYSVCPWNSVRRRRCCPFFDSGSAGPRRDAVRRRRTYDDMTKGRREGQTQKLGARRGVRKGTDAPRGSYA